MKLQYCLIPFVTLLDILYKCEAISNSSSTAVPLALYPIGDVRNCPVVSPITGQPLYRMEVLPGLGFDNLRNTDMNQVVQYNYSLCKTTNDGRFLIPDDMITVPIQKSSLETYSEVITHWDDYKSSTSFSINAEASALFGLIHGKFSAEYQHNKERQVNDHSVTTRTQVRNLLYKILLESDATLHPAFKNRLLDIAANLQNNNTEYAAYLSELIVRDYGTHVVRAAEAGGLMSQTDSVFYEMISDHTSTYFGTSASASANFIIFKLKMSASFTFSDSHDTYYEENRHHSFVRTVGGPPYKEGLTLEQWQDGLLNLLAPIDRVGDPLHWVITTRNIPELPTPLLSQVSDYLYTAIKRYYTINTIPGCTDPDALNFNFEANLDDGSCHKPHGNYSFGGVFQSCQVDSHHNYRDLCRGSNDEDYDGPAAAATENPLTGDYTCPSGFEAIHLHSGTVTHEDEVPRVTQSCTDILFYHHCKTTSTIEHVISMAYYQTYWCVATGKVPDDTGYMFGGVHTSDTINPNTGSTYCPHHFIPLRIGRDVEVCVSDEYQFGAPYSIPFGGFFSCEANNPLSTTKGVSTGSSQCPKSYQQMVATVEDGCEISYCTKLKVKYTSKPPKLPPFQSKPKAKTNITQAMVIVGSHGETWVRDAEGNWHEYQKTAIRITGEDVLRNLAARFSKITPAASNDTGPSVSPTFDSMTFNISTDAHTQPKGLSPIVSAVISSVVTLAFCCLVILAVFGVYGIIKKHKKATLSSSVDITDNTSRSTADAIINSEEVHT